MVLPHEVALAGVRHLGPLRLCGALLCGRLRGLALLILLRQPLFQLLKRVKDRLWLRTPLPRCKSALILVQLPPVDVPDALNARVLRWQQA